jgi:DNA-directed RNA polymerase specialized sigma24 family protein
LSEQQTADLLGCSVGTVKSQTFRGLAALRRRVGELTQDEWVAGETR